MLNLITGAGVSSGCRGGGHICSRLIKAAAVPRSRFEQIFGRGARCGEERLNSQRSRATRSKLPAKGALVSPAGARRTPDNPTTCGRELFNMPRIKSGTSRRRSRGGEVDGNGGGAGVAAKGNSSVNRGGANLSN